MATQDPVKVTRVLRRLPPRQPDFRESGRHEKRGEEGFQDDKSGGGSGAPMLGGLEYFRPEEQK